MTNTIDLKLNYPSVEEEMSVTKVPEAEEVKLGNDAVTLDATILYADLAESTNLVDNYRPEFAAEIYKSYLGYHEEWCENIL